MAKSTITSCDVGGESGPDDDVQTVQIRLDGTTWEVDLCLKHRQPIIKIASKGRQFATSGRGRDVGRRLEDMVRNPPS